MPARFCPQCGREVSSAARFCPHCGTSLAPGMPGSVAAAATRMDTAARDTRRLLLPLAVAALVVLVVAVAILASKLHQASLLSSQPPPPLSAAPLTNAPSSQVSAPPLTNAPTQPLAAAPPVTNAPTAPPAQLPPDVAAYLQFLKGIEDRRVALSNDTAGAMMMMQTAHAMQGDQGDPEQHTQNVPGNVSKLNQGFTDYNTKLQTLVGDFRSRAAPPACVALANQYYNFLTGYVKVIGQLQVAVLNGDLGAAMGAQGAQKQINAQALQADDALAQLCARYSAPKPFSIQPDGAGSSLLGQ